MHLQPVTNDLHIAGGDLTNVGTLFSDYISGLNSTLSGKYNRIILSMI